MPADRLPRRAVLAGGALTGAVLLAGCRVRLEDRSPEDAAQRAAAKAGVTVLGGLSEQVAGLAAQAAALTASPLAARLAVHHRDQLAVLASWAQSQGDAAPTATATARATAGRAPAATPQALALAERDGIEEHGLKRFTRLGSSERLTALGVLAHRVAAATLLTGGDVSGVQPGLDAAVSAQLLATLRPARFSLLTSGGLTTDAATRKNLQRALKVVESWESILTRWAGPQAPGEMLAYVPDPRPTSDANRTTLLRRVLGDVLSDGGTHLGTVTDPVHMLTLVTYLGELSAAGDVVGLPLTSFPGLRH